MAVNDTFVYDLLGFMRQNPKAAAEIHEAHAYVHKLIRLHREGKASHKDIAKAQAQLVTRCRFNFGLLMPFTFPKYPIDEPFSIVRRPFMFAMTSLTPNSTITLKAGRQVGKCVAGETKLVTTRGLKTLESLFQEGISV